MAARLETVGEQVSGTSLGEPGARRISYAAEFIDEGGADSAPVDRGNDPPSRAGDWWATRAIPPIPRLAGWTAASGSGQVALGDAHVDCSRHAERAGLYVVNSIAARRPAARASAVR